MLFPRSLNMSFAVTSYLCNKNYLYSSSSSREFIIMEKLNRTKVSLWLLFLFVTVLQFQPAVEETGQHVDRAQEELPAPSSFSEIVTNTMSTLQKTHQNYWDKTKAVLNSLQVQFCPPNLDFRDKDDKDAKEKMKEAAGKVVLISKGTVEDSAHSAAEVVGEALHSTSREVKNAIQDKDKSDAEL